MYTGLGGWLLRLAAADPKTGRTSADPGGFRRTPPPDPPGPRTDPGRTRHRTIRTRRTGGAHQGAGLRVGLRRGRERPTPLIDGYGVMRACSPDW